MTILSIAAMVVGLGSAGAIFLSPAKADEGLAPGACVSVRGTPGRIIGLTAGGYIVQPDNQGPQGAMNWPRSDVTQGPCPAGPPVPPPPAPGVVPPAPLQPADGDPNLTVGACVAIHGQAGRITRLTPGGYVIQTQGQPADQAMNWARTDVTQGPCPAGPAPNPAQLAGPAAQPVGPAPNPAKPAGPIACPVDNAANLGGGPQGRNIATAIRAIMNHPAAPGMDGAESATILSLQVGGGRAWNVNDSRNFSANPNQPVYDVRASLKLCTDYQAAIELRQEVSNFECFTSPAGQFTCQMSGTVNGMPTPTQRIDK